MKKTLVLTTIALLVSGSAAAKTWVLTNAEEGMDKGNWQINSDQLKVKDHAFSIEQKVLHGLPPCRTFCSMLNAWSFTFS